MDYEVDTKRGRLSVRSILLLLAGILLLPFCLLIPFADHSHILTPVLIFSSMDGTVPGCIARSNPVAHNQCAIWLKPHTIWQLAVLLLAITIAFSVGLNFYVAKLGHKDGKRFANLRFVLALFMSFVSFFVFAIMRDASQSHASYDFGLVTSNLASNGSIRNGGTYMPIHQSAFGYGITPAMAILIIAGFVLPAFVSWHQFIFSRRHIEGQKTKKLFQ